MSEGIYASLNCGIGSRDRPAHIVENRARAVRQLGLPPDQLATAYQVHGTTVRTIDGISDLGQRHEADALVTRTPGKALGVLTADCAPILFADPQSRVIGATHAGWRGALAGVIEATVAAMEALGARRDSTLAAVGPCIGKRSYEVGPEFPVPFVAEDQSNDALFTPSDREGRFHFDLEGYVTKRLRARWVSAMSRPRASTPAPTGPGSSVTDARPYAANKTMAGAFRRLRWRLSSAVPYLIIFIGLLALGLLATCVV